MTYREVRSTRQGQMAASLGASLSGVDNETMQLTRREIPILIVNLVYVPFFAVVALRELNFEFVLYCGVVLMVGALVVWNQHKLQFDRMILWGLTVWGFLHLSGGNVHVGGDDVLYGLILVPLEPRYNILRYDQVVHFFGFGVATLVCHHLLRPFLRKDNMRWGILSFLIVLMGSGLGAFNEILEFVAQETVPETQVGGYTNTMLDLVFNLLGGLLAVTWLSIRRRTESSRCE